MYQTPLDARILHDNPAVSDSLKASQVKRSVQITLSQIAKVAVQLSFVPVLLLVCGLSYVLAIVPGGPQLQGLSKASADTAGGIAAAVKSPEYVLCLMGFAGWWGSTVYMLWTGVGLVLSRAAALGVTELGS